MFIKINRYYRLFLIAFIFVLLIFMWAYISHDNVEKEFYRAAELFGVQIEAVSGVTQGEDPSVLLITVSDEWDVWSYEKRYSKAYAYRWVWAEYRYYEDLANSRISLLKQDGTLVGGSMKLAGYHIWVSTE